MFFVNPTYLWALLGLLIPIAIHLWNNKEGKTIKVGSIEFLKESDSKQASSIKLNEILLLITRLSILGLLTLILVQPQIKKNPKNSAITYLIEPSLLSNSKIKTILDTLETQEPIRFLQSGFPEVNSYISNKVNNGVPNYWQLAKDLETIATDSIVIYTNAFVVGLRGSRPIINKKVEWIILDGETSTSIPLRAIKKEDNYELTTITSDFKKVEFFKEQIAINSNQINLNETKDSLLISLSEKQHQVALVNETPINVVIYFKEEFRSDFTYLQASLNALSKHLNRPFNTQVVEYFEEIDTSEYDLLVWLSPEELQPKTGIVLQYNPDVLANSLIEKGPAKNLFYLTKSLNSENIFDQRLAEQLLKVFDLNSKLKEQIDQNDNRIVDKKELITNLSTSTLNTIHTKVMSISKWLWMSLFIILIFERFLARVKKQ